MTLKKKLFHRNVKKLDNYVNQQQINKNGNFSRNKTKYAEVCNTKSKAIKSFFLTVTYQYIFAKKNRKFIIFEQNRWLKIIPQKFESTKKDNNDKAIITN